MDFQGSLDKPTQKVKVDDSGQTGCPTEAAETHTVAFSVVSRLAVVQHPREVREYAKYRSMDLLLSPSCLLGATVVASRDLPRDRLHVLLPESSSQAATNRPTQAAFSSGETLAVAGKRILEDLPAPFLHKGNKCYPGGLVASAGVKELYLYKLQTNNAAENRISPCGEQKVLGQVQFCLVQNRKPGSARPELFVYSLNPFATLLTSTACSQLLFWVVREECADSVSDLSRTILALHTRTRKVLLRFRIQRETTDSAAVLSSKEVLLSSKHSQIGPRNIAYTSSVVPQVHLGGLGENRLQTEKGLARRTLCLRALQSIRSERNDGHTGATSDILTQGQYLLGEVDLFKRLVYSVACINQQRIVFPDQGGADFLPSKFPSFLRKRPVCLADDGSFVLVAHNQRKSGICRLRLFKKQVDTGEFNEHILAGQLKMGHEIGQKVHKIVQINNSDRSSNSEVLFLAVGEFGSVCFFRLESDRISPLKEHDWDSSKRRIEGQYKISVLLTEDQPRSYKFMMPDVYVETRRLTSSKMLVEIKLQNDPAIIYFLKFQIHEA